MKKSLLASSALLATLAALPTVSQAVEEGPESPLPINISLASEYRFRGLSQTRFKPALQGDLDYSAKSGLNVST